MNGASDELFAGSSFTQNQDSRINGGNRLDLLQHVTQRRTLAHYLRKADSIRLPLGRRIF